MRFYPTVVILIGLYLNDKNLNRLGQKNNGQNQVCPEAVQRFI